MLYIPLTWLVQKLAVYSISEECPYLTYAKIHAAITLFYFRRQGERKWTLDIARCKMSFFIQVNYIATNDILFQKFFTSVLFNSLQFSDDAVEENNGDPNVESYLADFFGNSPENAKSQYVSLIAVRALWNIFVWLSFTTNSCILPLIITHHSHSQLLLILLTIIGYVAELNSALFNQMFAKVKECYLVSIIMCHSVSVSILYHMISPLKNCLSRSSPEIILF